MKNQLLLLVSGIACLISVVVFSFFLTQTTKTQNIALASSYSKEQVLSAVNQERTKKQLPVLKLNTKLNNSAQAKAEDMANYKVPYFSHVSPSGKKWSDFIKESSYEYIIAGENLANGFESVSKMVEAWMNSPSHRENILNKEVEETGIGISYGKLDDRPTIFVVQHFGKEIVNKDKDVSKKDSNRCKISDAIQVNQSKNCENDSETEIEIPENSLGRIWFGSK